jgi:hypothetical protein
MDPFAHVGLVAVEEIARLTPVAVAFYSAQNALYMYAIHISVTIHNLAMRIPHNQQSQLIDFVVRLQQVTVPDPYNWGDVTARERRLLVGHASDVSYPS